MAPRRRRGPRWRLACVAASAAPAGAGGAGDRDRLASAAAPARKFEPCCGEAWFRRAMAELNEAASTDSAGCGHAGDSGTGIEHYYIHALGMFVQLYARRPLLPRNTTFALMRGAHWDPQEAQARCPLVLHLTTLLEAEAVLLGALPSLSDETPREVASAVLAEADALESRAAARRREAADAEGGGASVGVGSWPRGLPRELVAEAESRLKRFRGYVVKPGSWARPSWSDDVDVSLAHLWHVTMKECLLPGTRFRVGDMFGPHTLEHGESASAWEQAMLTVILALQSLPASLSGFLWMDGKRWTVRQNASAGCNRLRLQSVRRRQGHERIRSLGTVKHTHSVATSSKLATVPSHCCVGCSLIMDALIRR
eukprot:TRINITY_DN27247_c0_g1_i1.p1 TRINITY_DN27247_c0_g1~~TRINITY_DN27247_c0_g1_i1.p1  ORF type:complete len:387 (-),score=63.94 TRINITY_DN27247_c0_g1_i1:54-1160(-)